MAVGIVAPVVALYQERQFMETAIETEDGLFSPDNPDVPYIQNDRGAIAFAVIVCGGVGIAMFTGGVISTVNHVRTTRLRKRLVSAGFYIMADVVELRNRNIRVNGIAIFALRCTYKEGYRTYEFVSKKAPNAELYITTDNKIKVWVDRKDFTKYYIDFDSFPENPRSEFNGHSVIHNVFNEIPAFDNKKIIQASNPKKATNIAVIVLYIFAGLIMLAFPIGTIFGVLLILLAVYMQKQGKKRAELRERIFNEGHFIMADVISLEQHIDSDGDLTSTYTVKCSYIDEYGTMFEFIDRNVTPHPAPFITPENKIKIWVISDDYYQYVFDTEMQMFH